MEYAISAVSKEGTRLYRWGTEVTQSLARSVASAATASLLLLKGVPQILWNPAKAVKNISYAILMLKGMVYYALMFLYSLVRCGASSEYFDKIKNTKFLSSLKFLLSGDDAIYTATVGQIWKKIFGICDPETDEIVKNETEAQTNGEDELRKNVLHGTSEG